MEAVKQVSKNVATLTEAHQNFNRSDIDAIAATTAQDVTYSDRARGITVRGWKEWEGWLRTWKESFSDSRVDNPTYIDAGDTVIALFTGRGTNDGPIGPFSPSGKEMSVPMCEVVRFNDLGQVVRAEIFYDQMTILAQLGHMEPPASG